MTISLILDAEIEVINNISDRVSTQSYKQAITPGITYSGWDLVPVCDEVTDTLSNQSTGRPGAGDKQTDMCSNNGDEHFNL